MNTHAENSVATAGTALVVTKPANGAAGGAEALPAVQPFGGMVISKDNLLKGAKRLDASEAKDNQSIIVNLKEANGEEHFTVGMVEPDNFIKLQKVADALEKNWQKLNVVALKPNEFVDFFDVAYGISIAGANSSSGEAENDDQKSDDKDWQELVNFKVPETTTENQQNEVAQTATFGEKKADSARELAEQILRTALTLGASDVHIEMGPVDGQIRVRIDGILYSKFGGHNFSRVPNKVILQICGAIAASAKIDYNDLLNKVNDGTSVLNYRDKEGKPQTTRVRFASLLRKTDQGDGRGVDLTLRLNPSLITDIHALGIEPEVIQALTKCLGYQGGIGLIVGPTGSGKTNILASLHTMARKPGDRKVYEYADTLEAMFPGMCQTEITEQCSAPEIIKSYWRKDPDLLIASEIRDREATELLVQLALGGKLVLSTIHANSMSGVFSRLAKLGVDREDQADTLRFIVFTNLVRKLCPHCRKLGNLIQGSNPPAYAHHADPAGCAHCRFIGYRGRTAITEIMIVTAEVAEWIAEGVPYTKIVQQAEQKGFLFSVGEAIRRKIRSGITSAEEVARVIDSERRIPINKTEEKWDWREQHQEPAAAADPEIVPRTAARQNAEPIEANANVIDLELAADGSFGTEYSDLHFEAEPGITDAEIEAAFDNALNTNRFNDADAAESVNAIQNSQTKTEPNSNELVS